MKKLIFALSALAIIAICFVSCEQQESVRLYQGIVTVKTINDSCKLQLDESTILVPINQVKNPFGKEVRGYTSFEDKGVISHIGSTEYRSAQLYYLDSILTKKTSPNLGPEMNKKKYGDAAIDIYVDWMTVVEDGYVTIHFRGKWGDFKKVHTISLVKTNDKYTFELRHNLNGDDITYGYYSDGLVAYNIKDLFDGSKETYDITITHNSDGGKKTVVFHYTPGQSAHIGDTKASASVVGNDDITKAPIE